MDIKESYNKWAKHYDNNQNKTRDLDLEVSQKVLEQYHFNTILELGCGTGKNTVWLQGKAKYIISIDISSKMIDIARTKVNLDKVKFVVADINKDWLVDNNIANLICCNLVLEHIENIEFIFSEARDKLKENGKFFVCEFHPFKQYVGSQARFETEEGVHLVEAYTHHTSDFLKAAKRNGFILDQLDEWFDEDGDQNLPRLISFLFTHSN